MMRLQVKESESQQGQQGHTDTHLSVMADELKDVFSSLLKVRDTHTHTHTRISSHPHKFWPAKCRNQRLERDTEIASHLHLTQAHMPVLYPAQLILHSAEVEMPWRLPGVCVCACVFYAEISC